MLTLADFNIGATLDRRVYLEFELTIIRLLRYIGARPFKHLKVKSIIIKSIRNLIGRKWRSWRTGEIWQNLGELAEFGRM